MNTTQTQINIACNGFNSQPTMGAVQKMMEADMSFRSYVDFGVIVIGPVDTYGKHIDGYYEEVRIQAKEFLVYCEDQSNWMEKPDNVAFIPAAYLNPTN